MKKITLLPKWILPDTLPSVYDTQSGTALEMVAKVYGAMRTLQTEYNSFVDEINQTITDFTSDIEADQECFENKIIKIMHEYIIKVDEKIKLQDLTISEAVKYMKENIKVTTSEIIQEMKDNGELSEVVLDVFAELQEGITELENKITLFKADLETLITESEARTNQTLTEHDNRIKNLEDSRPSLIYNASEKAITITNLGGVE